MPETPIERQVYLARQPFIDELKKKGVPDGLIEAHVPKVIVPDMLKAGAAAAIAAFRASGGQTADDLRQHAAETQKRFEMAGLTPGMAAFAANLKIPGQGSATAAQPPLSPEQLQKKADAIARTGASPGVAAFAARLTIPR